MVCERIYLYENNKDIYLDTYICEMDPSLSIKKRPAILVIPGGGYSGCSRREAEPIARAYMAHGFNAAVLYYSVAPNATDKRPLIDASISMNILRKNAAAFNIDKNQIAVIGFSAGGHLAAWLGTMWDDQEVNKKAGIPFGANKPNAMVLSYPVITSGNMAHKGSFYNILGTENPTEKELAIYSLEKCVTKNTPPAFLWHTANDECVPVENSLYMAEALSKEKIPFELHIFPDGVHGLSLATDEVMPKGDPYVARWIEMSVIWLEKLFGINL